MEEKYEYTPLYYGTPCQVRFYEKDGTYCGGIAYHGYIICGYCGQVRLIEDIIKNATDAGIHWDNAIIELEWINISDSIIKG